MRSHLFRIAVLSSLLCLGTSSLSAQIGTPLSRGMPSANGESSVGTRSVQQRAPSVQQRAFSDPHHAASPSTTPGTNRSTTPGATRTSPRSPAADVGGKLGESVKRETVRKDGAWHLDLKPSTLKSETELPARKRTSMVPNGPLATTLGSLAAVLGLFFVLMWFVKRSNPKVLTALPNEAVEVLGHAPLSGKQQMQLVRLGNKLLLLSISQNGAEQIGELTDPDEVERVASICLQRNPASVSATFNGLLNQLGNERHERGFLETDSDHRENASSSKTDNGRNLFKAEG